MEPTDKQFEIIRDRNPLVLAAMARRTGKDQVAIWRAQRYPGKTLILTPDETSMANLGRRVLPYWNVERSDFNIEVFRHGKQQLTVQTYSSFARNSQGMFFDHAILLELAQWKRPTADEAWNAIVDWDPQSVTVLTTPEPIPEYVESPMDLDFFTELWQAAPASRHNYSLTDHPLIPPPEATDLRGRMARRGITPERIAADVDGVMQVPEGPDAGSH